MSASPKVVYLDDDEEDRSIMQDVFSELPGLELITVSNETALNQQIAQERVAVAIIDINLPVRNGIEILAGLRANSCTDSLPIIMFSTGERTSELKMIEHLGAYFMAKPDTMDGYGRLIELVQRLVPKH